MPLNDELETSWQEYLRAEEDRIRSLTMPALDRFIDRLIEQPPEMWHAWAKSLASAIADEEATTPPVRFPLFLRVLRPALIDGLQRGEAGCARWLASFDQLLYHGDNSDLPETQRTETGLLLEALRVDPHDDRARRRLVKARAWYLDFTLHELPAGVLCGMNGATAKECDELLELLEDFKKEVGILGETERFTDLIADCDRHYRLYAAYLREGRPEGGYEGYLKSHGGW